MIVSHTHKFIFIKTRKTAGTSLEIALSKSINLSSTDILTPLSLKNETLRKELTRNSYQNDRVPLNYYKRSDFFSLCTKGKVKYYEEHMSAANIRNYLPRKIWNEYYKFCFERNPLDFAVSLFNYHQQLGSLNTKNFDEFVDTQLHLYSNFDLYSDKNKIIVDQVFRYEEMENSFQFLQEKLNLNDKLDIGKITANKFKKNLEISLSQDTIDKIKKILSREYAYFY